MHQGNIACIAYVLSSRQNRHMESGVCESSSDISYLCGAVDSQFLILVMHLWCSAAEQQCRDAFPFARRAVDL